MSCRVSIALAVCLAMAGTLNVSARPAAGTKDRGPVTRVTRSGSFRIDSPEPLLHSHEHTKPDAAFSSLVVGQEPSALDSAANDAPPAVGLADTFALAVLAGPGACAAFGLRTSPGPGASAPSTRPPGRAPPFTA